MRTIFRVSGSKGLPDEARDALLTKHYLSRVPSISTGFVLMDEVCFKAVCTFGTPASRHLQMSACKSNPGAVIELNRLWIDDDMPRNTASWFVSECLRALEPFIVVSYADTRQGHAGYVYRACNFFYAGLTDQDRRTPRFDYVPRNGKHSRDAFRSNDFDRVRRLPKHRYWTVTGDRRQRREMMKIATWPQQSWPA